MSKMTPAQDAAAWIERARVLLEEFRASQRLNQRGTEHTLELLGSVPATGYLSTLVDPDAGEEEESDVDYLRGLAERLRHIAAMHGVDGGDVDRLQEIAKEMEIKKGEDAERGMS